MPAKSHGESRTELYRKWLLMKRSCNNPNAKSYKTIGGQGIQVDPEWAEDYTKFKAYSLENGYKDNLVIDRKDKSKDFEPGNVIFVTFKERQRNKSVKNLVTYKGKTQSIRAWAEDIGVTRQALYARIQRKGSAERTLDEAFAEMRKKR